MAEEKAKRRKLEERIARVARTLADRDTPGSVPVYRTEQQRGLFGRTRWVQVPVARQWPVGNYSWYAGQWVRGDWAGEDGVYETFVDETGILRKGALVVRGMNVTNHDVGFADWGRLVEIAEALEARLEKG